MNRHGGFTMVETLVGAVVAVLLLSAAMAFWRSGLTSTGTGMEILEVSREMGCLARAVAADSLKTTSVRWDEDGCRQVPPGQEALDGLLQEGVTGMPEVILEGDGTRVTWRFQAGTGGLGTIERVEEAVAADAAVPVSTREFGRGMVSGFRLVPLERDQVAAPGDPSVRGVFLACRVVMVGPSQVRSRREFVLETVYSPVGLAPTAWLTNE